MVWYFYLFRNARPNDLYLSSINIILAQYCNLSLPHDEDLKEFRSSASVLSDKDFLARLSFKAGRMFLRPGRPAKRE